MIKLELNKIPGYSLSPNITEPERMEVTIHYGASMTFYTMCTIEEMGGMVEEEPVEIHATVEDKIVHKVTEETLLKTIAMLHGVKEIPK